MKSKTTLQSSGVFDPRGSLVRGNKFIHSLITMPQFYQGIAHDTIYRKKDGL